MRYLALLAFTTVVSLLVSIAAATGATLAAAREGKPAAGVSVLSYFLLGWVLAGLGFAWDNSALFGGRLPPYGFWGVLILYGLFGIYALIMLVYATVALRRLRK